MSTSTISNPQSSARRKGGPGRIIAIVLGVIVVLLVAIVALAPMLAGGFVPGTVPFEASGRTYNAKISGVSLSWFGKQQVRSVTVEDSAGAKMADLSFEGDKGLAGILLSGGDVGTFIVSGSADVKQSQIGPSGPPVIDATKPAPAPSPAGPAARVVLPAGLKARLEARKLNLTFTPDQTAGAAPVRVVDLDVTADLFVGGSSSLTVRSVSPALSVDAKAANLFSPAGVLQVEKSEVQIDASLDATAQFVASVVGLLGTGSTDDAGPLRASAALVTKGGRLQLVDPSRPLTIEGTIPAALVEAMAGKGVKVELASSPMLKATVADIDLPMGGASDLRGSGLRAALVSGAIEGKATLADGSTKTFRIEPLDFQLLAPDLAQSISLKGKTRASIDGREAGELQLDIEAQQLLDDDGAQRPLPGVLRALVELRALPTRFAEPFLKDLGVSPADVVGETLDLSLTARTRDEDPGTQASAGAGVKVPPTDMVLELSSDHLQGYASLVATESRIWTEQPNPIKISASRLGPALRAVLAQSNSPIEVTGDGTAEIQLSEVDVPLSAMGPDLSKSSLTLSAPISGLTVSAAEGMSPIELTGLATALKVKPGEAPRLDIDWRVTSRGRATRAVGGLSLDKLVEFGEGGSFKRVAPEAVRPQGQVAITGIPSDLMGLLPAELVSGVEQSLGRELAATLQAQPGPGQSADVTLALTGDGLDAQGVLRLDAGAITTTDERGLTITLSKPEALAKSLAMREGGPIETLAWSAPVVVRLTDVAVPLPKGDEAFSPGSAKATLTLQSSGIAATLADSAGTGASASARRLTIEDLQLGVTHTPADGAALQLAGKGMNAGQAITMSGTLATGKLFGASGQLDVAGIKPEGRIEVLGLPTALASVFDAQNGPLASEAIGPTLDLLVTAPAAPIDPVFGPSPDRGVAISARGRLLIATTSVGLTGRTVVAGPTKVRATVTGPLVAAAMAAYAPELSPRPALAEQFVAVLDAQPVRFDLASDNTMDRRTLRSITASLTTEGLIVLKGLPGASEGKTISAGLRGLEAGLGYDPMNLPASEASLKVELFDPAEPASRVAFLSAESSASGSVPPDRFEVKLIEIDTQRLDRMLGMPALTSEPLGKAAGLTLRGGMDQGGGAQSYSAIVNSERLKTEAVLARSADRLTLVRPATLAWEISPAWANQYLAPKGADGQPTLTFKAPVALKGALNALVIGYPEAMLGADIFKVDLSAESPSVKVADATGQVIEMAQLKALVATDREPGALGVGLTTNISVAGAGPATPVKVQALASRLFSKAGDVQADTAVVTADVDGNVPTVVLDALGNQKGTLVDLLGPTTKVLIKARELSKSGGSLSADVRSENTAAKTAGDVRNNVFVTTQPTTLTISRVTPEFSARFIETAIPLIARVEKTTEDEPGTVTATGLTVPTDGDMRQLNGDVIVDLGTVRFETASFFGKLVKLTQNRTGGKIGERIKPFNIAIRQGIANYEKFEVPLGEFTAQTEGSVNLVNETLDVVVFVPFYALASEVSGALSNVPGLDRLTQIPIRIHGPLDNPKTDVKVEAIITDNLGEAIRDVIPGNVKDKLPPEIGKGVEDAIKDIFKGGKKKN